MAEIKQKILTDEIKTDEILEDPSDPFGLGDEVGAVTNVTNVTNVVGSLPSYITTTITTNAGGADKQVQFNDGGSTFGTDTDFTWDKTNNILTLAAANTTGKLEAIDGTGATIGGSLEINSGNGGSTDAGAGTVLIQGGAGGGNGYGGAVDILAGAGGSSGAGGVSLQGGDGTGGVGGQILISSGDATGGALAGNILIQPGSDTGQNGYIEVGGGGQRTQLYVKTVSTTNNSATTLFTHSPTSSSSNFYEARVKAIRTGGSAGTAQDSAAYVVQATYKRVGTAAPTLVGAINALYTAEDQAGWDCTFVVVGNTVEVQVTGATNNNIDWGGQILIKI